MIRIVLCDDNGAFLESLRREIRSILRKYDVDAEIYSYSRAGDIPAQMMSSCDGFFLDVDLSLDNMTGVDLARQMRGKNATALIIFVTNYIEYAPDGYEVQAFRYLLKRDISQKLEPCLLQMIKKMNKEQEAIRISVSGEIISIPQADVLYIEASGHLLIVHVQKKETRNKKTYEFYSSLAKLEQQAEFKDFLRTQKSYLVNMQRICQYNCVNATLDNGETLRVSEKNYSEQKKKYLLWKGKQ